MSQGDPTDVLQELLAINTKINTYISNIKSAGGSTLSACESAALTNYMLILQLNQTAINNLQNKLSNYNKGVLTALSTAAKTQNALDLAEPVMNEIYEDNSNKIKKMKMENSTMLKKTQFNGYFTQRYMYEIFIMKVLVVMSIFLMVFILLFKKGIIGKSVYSLSMSVIIAISIFIVVLMVISELRRSNTKFQEYNWFFNST